MTNRIEPLTRDAALEYLLGRIDYERVPRFPYRAQTLKLARMRELLSRLGNPHDRYPIVHVAGTKGKGSTSAMIASILGAAGHRAGLYTSPHLEQVEERMTVDGCPSTGEEFAALIARVRVAVDAMDRRVGMNGGYESGPTYFEITTAAAMLHFAQRQVDVAVLEVGLGGRLDSTNVCRPEVSVITSISFDHTRQLGNTLAAIAGEKAGIIKPGIPVVSGVANEEPAEVIRARAQRLGCPYFEIGRDFQLTYRGIELATLAGTPRLVTRLDYAEPPGTEDEGYRGLQTGLLGRHQAANAAVAVATICRLQQRGWAIPTAAVREGLRQARIPARTEVVQCRPIVVVDAAHNVASIQALVDVLDEAFPEVRSRILVFATSRDKDLAGMLRCLLPKFSTVILTRYLNNPRYVEPVELKELADEIAAADPEVNCQVLVEACPAAAWSAAEALATDDALICVSGSFFLAAEVRNLAQTSPLRKTHAVTS
ncbi:MAG: bifunctional folylpolyglutamate synthase/dihydrofolate synthase [Pirellulaceae bacterium]|nr:bifunctional folylpolyglutamate synthase/dihydrofolate synthase [Pirellulaceae bacterium]